MLQTISAYIDTIPAINQPMRFGNKAFRTFLDKVKETYPTLIGMVLQTEGQMRAASELQEYLLDSFGSYERIDYGSYCDNSIRYWT
jgi:hypothetical protein